MYIIIYNKRHSERGIGKEEYENRSMKDYLKGSYTKHRNIYHKAPNMVGFHGFDMNGTHPLSDQWNNDYKHVSRRILRESAFAGSLKNCDDTCK